jgi:glycosyltransferase involved in cell wall biosynthesis
LSTLLSINNYYYYRGGAETLFLEQNELLRNRGWTVVPFSMKHKNNLATKWSEYFVDEIEFGERYSAAQQMRRAFKVIYSVEAKRKLTTLIDIARPDVCHAHNIYHHISPSILSVLKRRSIPTVLTLHDLKIACPAYNMLSTDGICERCKGGRIYNVVRHRCIKGSVALSAVVMLEAALHRMLGSYRKMIDRFVVPSRFYIDKLIEWGFDPALFRHIPNFVRPERYIPEFAPGDAFLYFGRVSREKGLDTLIRAAAASGARVRIAGTGHDVESLRRLTLELGAKVEFLGYLTGESLHSAIRSARAVVLPSEWYENAPMSILEAYALGKPIIGARIGGIPELLIEERTGISFESGSVESLAAVLSSFDSMSNERLMEMGRGARQWVSENFNESRYCDRLSSLYSELNIALPIRPAAQALA